MIGKALAAHVVPGLDPAPNFSVQLAGHDGDDASGFHFLYRGFTPVVRTLDLRRLVDAVFGHLDSLQLPGPAGYLRLNVLALVRDGSAVLCPPDLRQALAALERRLNAAGFSVVDRPFATVDPATGELVVEEPRLSIDRQALDGLDRLQPAAGGRRKRRPEVVVTPGRYPVGAWAFGRGEEGAGPLPASLALAEATRLVTNVSELGARTVLDGLRRTLTGIPAAALWSKKPEGLVPPIAALAG